ncbi:MAG: hypothetical protein ACTHN3_05230 [Solirubrobacterales bacterium]
MTVDLGSRYGSRYGSQYGSQYGSRYGSHRRRTVECNPACRLPSRRPASLTSIPERGSKS